MSEVIDKFKQDGEKGGLFVAWTKICCVKQHVIDGVTKEEYGRDLERKLEELHERLKSGKYRASPVLRRWIEKPSGGKRPLGLPTSSSYCTFSNLF
jgi:retron-type reverse transcriptase